MTPRVVPNEVVPTSEVRKNLSAITQALADRGAAAGLVVYGAYRKPEAAVIPYELVELLDPVIEDLVIAARARERLKADRGARLNLDEVAKKFGVEFED